MRGRVASRTRILLALVVTVLAVLSALPSLVPADVRLQRSWPRWWPALRFGADLQGGTQWWVSIDPQEVAERRLLQLGEELTRRGPQGLASVAVVKGSQLEVCAPDPRVLERLRDDLRIRPTSHDGSCSSFELRPGVAADSVRRATIQQAEQLRQLLPEAEVRIVGIGNVFVERPEGAPGVYGHPTDLSVEFKRVVEVASSESALLERYQDDFPAATSVVAGERASDVFLVADEPVIGGPWFLEDARVWVNGGGRPVVILALERSALERVRELTRTHVDARVVLIVDGTAIAATRLPRRIGPELQIDGGFTWEEAADLARRLRLVGLPIPMRIEAERTFGSELAAVRFEGGLHSVLVGIALLMAIGVLRYRGSGTLASGALLLTALMTVGWMSFLRLELTLAGFAGIALAASHCLVAHALVFERIREELAGGSSPRAALAAGFARAMPVVWDRCFITALIAAALYHVAREPAAGLAAALALGAGSLLVSLVAFTRPLMTAQLEWAGRISI